MTALLFKCIAVGLLTLALTLFLRGKSPEQSLLLTLGFLCVSGVWLLTEASSVLGEYLRLGSSALQEGFSCVVKAVGISLVTQSACDTCCDYGQTALAGKLEFAGKLAILAAALPLFKEMLTTLEKLLS